MFQCLFSLVPSYCLFRDCDIFANIRLQLWLRVFHCSRLLTNDPSSPNFWQDTICPWDHMGQTRKKILRFNLTLGQKYLRRTEVVPVAALCRPLMRHDVWPKLARAKTWTGKTNWPNVRCKDDDISVPRHLTRLHYHYTTIYNAIKHK